MLFILTCVCVCIRGLATSGLRYKPKLLLFLCEPKRNNQRGTSLQVERRSVGASSKLCKLCSTFTLFSPLSRSPTSIVSNCGSLIPARIMFMCLIHSLVLLLTIYHKSTHTHTESTTHQWTEPSSCSSPSCLSLGLAPQTPHIRRLVHHHQETRNAHIPTHSQNTYIHQPVPQGTATSPTHS